MSNPFKAAVVQAAPVFLDLAGSIDKCVRLIEEAAANGAALVAFPETFVPGYPWFIWLDSPAWGLQFIPRYHENSLVLGSPEAQRLSDAARHNRIHVAMGHSERDGGSLYMGQWLIGPDGETISVRRKLKPTHVERTVYGEGDGSDLAVHKTALGNMGALCCWEHLRPLSKYAMYAQNEQIHVAAWPSFSLYDGMAHALGAEVNVAASRIYAVEGGCFVSARRGPPGREPPSALSRWLRWRLRCVMDGVVEIITGRERRRRWSRADKLRIVGDTHEPGVRVCHVAARHGMCESLLFAWRRQVREGLLVEPDLPVFMPVQMLGTPAAALPQPAPASAAAPGRSQVGLIEIELGDGRQVRVGADVNQAALRRVLAALRG